MKKQSLLILLIILAGSSASIVYATGTVITNTGITTGDLTVTGTCTGCGGEASYTSYAKIFNNTISGSVGDTIYFMTIGTDKSILAVDTISNATVINSSEVLVGFSRDQGTYTGPKQSDSSINGKYKIIWDSSSRILSIFKNNVLLQQLTISATDFFGSSTAGVSFSISSDGHYIGMYGRDVGGSLNRLVILQGS